MVELSAITCLMVLALSQDLVQVVIVITLIVCIVLMYQSQIHLTQMILNSSEDLFIIFESF